MFMNWSKYWLHLFLTKGFITDKEALPVTELHFGRNQLSGSSGRYTLGKLECSGRSTFNEIPIGCRDLYEIGHVLNGFYPVKNGNKIDMVYCDFSSFDEGISFSLILHPFFMHDSFMLVKIKYLQVLKHLFTDILKDSKRDKESLTWNLHLFISTFNGTPLFQHWTLQYRLKLNDWTLVGQWI